MRSRFRALRIWILAGLLLAPAFLSSQAEEIHPTLLFSSTEIPALREKLGSSTISDGLNPVGNPLTAAILGKRSDWAIDWALQEIQKVPDGGDLYAVLLAYDHQAPYMTETERKTLRDRLVANAQTTYENSFTGAWWYQPQLMNNWLYRYAGHPLQNILYSGILFTDDPRSAQWRERGFQLWRQLTETWPSDGVWNQETWSWITPPTTTDLVDETAGAPNAYGVWGAGELVEAAHVVERAFGLNIETTMNGLWKSEAAYWTYNLNHAEAENFNGSWDSYASYGGVTGHSWDGALLPYSNGFMLYWAWRFRDPVLAWHYYANPSGREDLGDQRDFLSSWNQPLRQYSSWWEFLGWGQPWTRPDVAGWPLTRFWPNAGIAILRLSWAKNPRVIAEQGFPDAVSGKVWMYCGEGGSKFRPAVGTVLFEADGHNVLEAGPFESSVANEFLLVDPHTQNTLFIDDAGQNDVFKSVHLGVTTRLGPDTFVMDPSSRQEPGFNDIWSQRPFGVNWKRKVHLHRGATANDTILWIKDLASTFDRATKQPISTPREYRFNWINPQATARAGDPTTYDLGNGWLLLAHSDAPIHGTIRAYDQGVALSGDPAHAFQAVWAGVDGERANVRWVITKDESAGRRFLLQNAGVFVSDVRIASAPGGVVVSWATDEPSSGRIELGATRSLGAVQAEVSPGGLKHEVRLPPGDAYFRILAEDAAGDATVDDNQGELYRTADAAAGPEASGDTRFLPFPNHLVSGQPLRARYLLGDDGPVTFRVRDVQTGRVIATWGHETLAAGPYETVWDLVSDARENVASGVYLLTLEHNGRQAATAKFVVIH